MPAPKLPNEWRQLAAKAGLNSYAEIARKAGGGMSSSTVQRALTGATAPEPSTVRRLAAAFGVSPGEVAKLLGVETGTLGWWDPPAEAHRLDADARNALSELIRLLARREGDSDGRRPDAQKTPPGPKGPHLTDEDRVSQWAGHAPPYDPHEDGPFVAAQFEQLVPGYRDQDDDEDDEGTVTRGPWQTPGVDEPTRYAARSGTSDLERINRQVDRAGEESQDRGGEDPA